MVQINIQLSLSLLRIIELLLLMIILGYINAPYQKIRFQQRPLMHRLFFTGICGWAMYIFFDILIPYIAPLSFDASLETTVFGFTREYPSLFIANIFKRLAFFGMFAQIWCYYFASVSIQHGEAYTKNQMRKPVNLIIFAILYFAGFVQENVQISIQNNLIIVGTIGDTFSSFAKYVIPMVAYLISAYQFNQALDLSVKESKSPAFRKRIQFFQMGNLVLGISYIWYLTNRVLAMQLQLYNDVLFYLTVSYILHGLWITSSILIFVGIYVSKQNAVQIEKELAELK